MNVSLHSFDPTGPVYHIKQRQPSIWLGSPIVRY